MRRVGALRPLLPGESPSPKAKREQVANQQGAAWPDFDVNNLLRRSIQGFGTGPQSAGCQRISLRCTRIAGAALASAFFFFWSAAGLLLCRWSPILPLDFFSVTGRRSCHGSSSLPRVADLAAGFLLRRCSPILPLVICVLSVKVRSSQLCHSMAAIRSSLRGHRSNALDLAAHQVLLVGSSLDCVRTATLSPDSGRFRPHSCVRQLTTLRQLPASAQVTIPAVPKGGCLSPAQRWLVRPLQTT